MADLSPSEIHAPSSSSSEDILDLTKDEGWEDAEPDEEQEHFISLLDDEVFPDIHSMLKHCKEKHNFDFLEIRQNLGLDFYDNIKLVNYVRSRVHDGKTIPSAMTKEAFDDEKYLKPVLEDDALLFNLDELQPVETEQDNAKGKEFSNTELVARVSELEEELRNMQSQFNYFIESVEKTLDERWNSSGPLKSGDQASKEEKRDDDSHYFSSYSYNEIHETMLKDTVRTEAYRDFIYGNKHLFAGKTVLDIGCGTGILSLFCARAGASLVIAVDNSSIIDRARSHVFANSLSPPIVLLKCKIEEVTLPVEKVDIIISEWMGYALLYEAMLDSVLWARDRYLKEDGLMVPSHMNLWTAPIEDPDYIADHISWWRDVSGFDMGAMQEGIHDDAQVLVMPESTLCSAPFLFLQLDLYTITVKDLSFKREWKAKLTRDIDELDGFIVWFDAFFAPSRTDTAPLIYPPAKDWCKNGGEGVVFTTGPFGKATHWKQAVLLIDNTKKKATPRKEGEEITGVLEYSVPQDNSRALNVGMTWKFGGKEDEKEKLQAWGMR